MVTRDTPWLAGTPGWADVTVGDVPKAIAFYQALFGWGIESGAPETGGYSICHKNGRIVAGLSPNFGPPGALPTWTTYLAADDAAAVAAAIKAGGGHDRGPPRDQGGGRPAAGRAGRCHRFRPDGPGCRYGRSHLRPVAGRDDDRDRPGQRDRLADLERASEPGLRREQGLLPRRLRLRLPGRERGRLQVRDAHGRRARGRRHRPVSGRDAGGSARSLVSLLRRRRHRRGGVLGRPPRRKLRAPRPRQP